MSFEIFVPFILIWAAIIGVGEITGSIWRKVTLTETGVEVTLYGFWNLKRIPYGQIVQIRRATTLEGLIGWVSLSRDRLTKPAVTIVWRQGGLNKYILSPRDADQFIAQVRTHTSGENSESH